MNKYADFIIVGASIIDLLAQPVSPDVFTSGSFPVERIAMQTGGDAINEASVLASLGGSVRLISKIGKDSAGNYILDHCRRLFIDTSYITEETSIDTSINIVLVDSQGERYFITSPNGSLRTLHPADIADESLTNGRLFCFASIFAYPYFINQAFTDLFRIA